MVLDSLQH
uniref:Uncharacterized protein n=1 Tax=Arundo donax TaxID=35708 RepID=A0A0A9F1Z6_ARUDO